MGRLATGWATTGAAMLALWGCGEDSVAPGSGGADAAGGAGGQVGLGGAPSNGGSTGQGLGVGGSGGATLITCDPAPDPGSFYAQIGEQQDANGVYNTQMCVFKDEVLLVVNAAQL